MSPMVFFGLVASAVLLTAFALLNLGKLTTEHYSYQFMNFAGAGFLAISAWNPFNAGVFWTEVIWSGLGVYGLVKVYLQRRRGEGLAAKKTK